MKIEEYIESQKPEEIRRAQYEKDCSQLFPGYLNAHDVCRLFGREPYARWSSSPGLTARSLITDLSLPLMELGPGRWVVKHTIEGLN